jgi:hypothetical protein
MSRMSITAPLLSDPLIWLLPASLQAGETTVLPYPKICEHCGWQDYWGPLATRWERHTR